MNTNHRRPQANSAAAAVVSPNRGAAAAPCRGPRLLRPLRPIRRRRKKKIPYTYQEKKTVLVAVNTVGVGSWKKILNAHLQLFAVHGRDNVSLKDIYRDLVKNELACANGPTQTSDCFTQEGMRVFSLRAGDVDALLL